MSELRIPTDAMVFVGEGRKALFLRNTGGDVRPRLLVEQVVVDENPNPSTHEQGATARVASMGGPLQTRDEVESARRTGTSLRDSISPDTWQACWRGSCDRTASTP